MLRACERNFFGAERQRQVIETGRMVLQATPQGQALDELMQEKQGSV